MRKKIYVLLLALALASCAAVPKATVSLSRAIGDDLQVLHSTHRNIIQIHFKKIIDDVNSLVDDVYTPYIINYVLNADKKRYTANKPSLLRAIDAASQKQNKLDTDSVLFYMTNFLSSAHRRIDAKRAELLSPIQQQQGDLLSSIDQSYENAINANAVLTGYLESLQKIKASQEAALKKIGLNKTDSIVTNSLAKLSDQVQSAIQLGRKIDLQSNDAESKLEEVSKSIKAFTIKKK